MKYEGIQTSIQSLQHTCAIEARVVIDVDSTASSYGGYDPEHHAIILRLRPLYASFIELKKQDIMFHSLEEFAQVVFWHEVGHAMDPNIQHHHARKQKILQEIDELTSEEAIEESITSLSHVLIESEVTAWEYAKSSIPSSISPRTLQSYISYCLHSYADWIHRFYGLVQERRNVGNTEQKVG